MPDGTYCANSCQRGDMPITEAGKLKAVSVRVARCLRVVDQLQSGLRRTVSELAEERGASRRTVFRDLRVLQEAGLEMRFNIKESRYVVDSALNIKPASLSKDEWLLLLLAAHITGLSMGEADRMRLQRTIAKLLAGMSVSLSNNLSQAINAATGDDSAAGWPGRQSPFVGEILLAIRQKQYLRLLYDTGGGNERPVQTKVTPYRLVIVDSHWALVGRSSWHRTVRNFTLEHIRHAEMLEEKFL
jgi:predicted DNA-binding transcriptional regulator YafY